MLQSKNKISSTEFNQFYTPGKKSFSKNFRVSVVLGQDSDEPKYAVVISKKVVKTAVSRHKNKRKIYNIIRQIYPQFSSVKYGFVFIQRDISLVDDSVLKSELLEIFRKLVK